MKYSALIVVLAISLAGAISCSRSETNHSERYHNLLGRWRLTQFGVDSNSNGILESSERRSAPVDPRSEEEYFEGGTGKAYLIPSVGSPVEGPFNWYLINDDMTLRTVTEEGTSAEIRLDYPILSLTSQELIRYYVSSSDSGYMVFTKL
jgi:hypothetical protein